MSIGNSLIRIRNLNNLSQEKLAEQLQVSRQTIQKWESGTGTPDLSNIIRIAKRFSVTIDSLILNSDRRLCEELYPNSQLMPDYSTLGPWESYSSDLLVEFRQCIDEGKDIEPYRALFNAVQQMPVGPLKKRMGDVLFDLTLSLPMVPDYQYDEPSDLDGIFALCYGNTEDKNQSINMEKLPDKISGAWLGRICGCLLGKPLEGIRTAELHPLLKESGNWPMHRYVLSSDITPEMIDRCSFRLKNRCYADTIHCAPADDDTNYVVMAQLLIEKHGRDFTSDDVARVWMDSQPRSAYCTAERVAFCNLINGYNPPNSALYQNPYREWIGAQIRGDYYGYINPGNPMKAAEMAWRDARISHIKNGIYGEMFIAAMVAKAAVDNDIEAIISSGLSVIPTTSRLFEAVKGVISDYLDGISEKECMAKIHKNWDENNSYDWCHTIPNAMIVTAGLLYGNGDYGKSICLAVQEGFDTDCNGATIGSIIGMRNGAKLIPKEWVAPINGSLDTNIFGIENIAIEELVKKTMIQIE